MFAVRHLSFPEKLHFTFYSSINSIFFLFFSSDSASMYSQFILLDILDRYLQRNDRSRCFPSWFVDFEEIAMLGFSWTIPANHHHHQQPWSVITSVNCINLWYIHIRVFFLPLTFISIKNRIFLFLLLYLSILIIILYRLVWSLLQWYDTIIAATFVFPIPLFFQEYNM